MSDISTIQCNVFIDFRYQTMLLVWMATHCSLKSEQFIQNCKIIQFVYIFSLLQSNKFFLEKSSFMNFINFFKSQIEAFLWKLILKLEVRQSCDNNYFSGITTCYYLNRFYKCKIFIKYFNGHLQPFFFKVS